MQYLLTLLFCSFMGAVKMQSKIVIYFFIYLPNCTDAHLEEKKFYLDESTKISDFVSEV